MKNPISGYDLIPHLQKVHAKLSAVDKRLADFFISSSAQVPDKTITELADLCGVSEASIIRFAKKMGFSGFYQMKIELAKSLHHQTGGLDVDDAPDTIEGIVRRSLDMSIHNIRSTIEHLACADLEEAVRILSGCSQVYFFAAGNSVLPCLAFMYKLGKLGIQGHMSEIPEMSLLQARNMREGDIAFALSHSGDSTLVNEALQIVHEKGLPVIGITNYQRSPIVKWTDIALVSTVRESVFPGANTLSRLSETAILDLLFYLLFYAKRGTSLEFISQTESDQALFSL